MNHAPGSAPEQGKNLYTLYPKQGTDTAATTEFIRSTVNSHDLHPWTDVHEQLMSWTVEALPTQVTQLEGHDGIDRVAKLEIPKHHDRPRQDDSLQKYTIYPVDGRNLDQCNATGASLKALIDDKLDGPRIWDGTVRSWTGYLTKAQVEQVEAIDGVKAMHPVHKEQKSTIYPVNGQNLDQCNATGASLRAILGDKVNEPRIWDGTVKSWGALLTKAQVEQVEAIDGVKGVHPVHKGRRGRFVRGLRKPSTSPKASGTLETRGVMNETQQNAAPELVAASQPSAIPVLEDL